MENSQNQNIQSDGILNIPQKTNNKPSKTQIVWSVIVLSLAIIFFGFLLFSKYANQNKIPKSVISDTLPAGYKFSVLKKDQYPTGFPKDIIVKGGVWQRSEDTIVGSGERQRIVELVYNDVDITKLATEYEATLLKNAWKEVSKTNSEELVVYNYSKNNDTLAFIISPKGTGSFVNIKYMDK
jgi:hypothetical protein